VGDREVEDSNSFIAEEQVVAIAEVRGGGKRAVVERFGTFG
jgi:hypothetical protein